MFHPRPRLVRANGILIALMFLLVAGCKERCDEPEQEYIGPNKTVASQFELEEPRPGCATWPCAKTCAAYAREQQERCAEAFVHGCFTKHADPDFDCGDFGDSTDQRGLRDKSVPEKTDSTTKGGEKRLRPLPPDEKPVKTYGIEILSDEAAPREKPRGTEETPTVKGDLLVDP